MKTKHLSILAFLMLNFNLFAQEFNWKHAYDAGGMSISTNKIKSTPDREGGLLMAMNFKDSINPDPQQPNDFTQVTGSFDDYGSIISKLDANGNLVFSHIMETNYYEYYYIHDILSKSDGNFYVIATSRLATYPIDIDPTAGTFLLNNPGLIISSFDANGNFITAKTLAVESYLFEYFEGAITENDELVFNGTFTYNSHFSETPGVGEFNTGTGRRAFTVKYDANLNYVWGNYFENTRPAMYSVFNYGNIAASPNGKTYSSFAFGGTITLENGSTYTAVNDFDVIIVEYNHLGNVTGDFLYTSSRESDYIQSIAVSEDNRIAVIGYANDITDLDVKGTYSGTSVTSGFGHYFIALYDESFNLEYFKSGSGGNTRPKSCKFNADGELLIAGRLFGTFDFDFDLDPFGNQFYKLTSSNYQIFLAKYDDQLNVTYAKSVGNLHNYGDIEKINIDEFDNIFIAGEFGTSAVDVNFGPLVNEVTGTKSPYGFIAKYNMCDTYLETRNISVCPGSNYVYPDGQSAINIQNTVTRTFYNVMNSSCDSIVTYVITPNLVYNIEVDLEICAGESYTFPDGTTQTNIQANTSYSSNLTSVLGCDSIIVTNIEVKPVFNTSENSAICAGESYTFPDGTTQTNIQANTSYSSNLTSVLGCDSIIVTNLTVTAINSTVTQNGNSLEVAQTNAVYQWYNCGNSTAIPNETNQTIVPTSTGSYQVEIEFNGCTVTSACESIQIAGLDSQVFSNLKLYPNPTESIFTVEYTEGIEKIEIFTFDGKRVHAQLGNNQLNVGINISELASGSYITVITSNNVEIPMRIFKK